ncbi:hypothetical protein GCM10027299_58540 [Larkinella ripae]
MKRFVILPTALALFSLLFPAAGTDVATHSGTSIEPAKTDAPNSSVGGAAFQSDQEILAKLKTIMKAKLGADPKSIQLKSRLIEDLGADPLGVVEVCMEIDKAFNTSTSAKDCEGIRTVKDALDVIKKNLKNKR